MRIIINKVLECKHDALRVLSTQTHIHTMYTHALHYTTLHHTHTYYTTPHTHTHVTPHTHKVNSIIQT